MVAMLAFGGTYAYFTATTGAVTSDPVTTAKVQLGAPTITNTTKATPLLPGEKFVDAVNIASSSDVDTYVFVVMTLSVTKDGQPVTLKNKAGETIAVEDLYAITYADAATGFTKFTSLGGSNANVYWSKVNANTATANFVAGITLSAEVFSNSTTASEGDAMSADVVVTIDARAAQCVGWEGSGDAEKAANAYNYVKDVANTVA